MNTETIKKLQEIRAKLVALQLGTPIVVQDEIDKLNEILEQEQKLICKTCGGSGKIIHEKYGNCWDCPDCQKSAKTEFEREVKARWNEEIRNPDNGTIDRDKYDLGRAFGIIRGQTKEIDTLKTALREIRDNHSVPHKMRSPLKRKTADICEQALKECE